MPSYSISLFHRLICQKMLFFPLKLNTQNKFLEILTSRSHANNLDYMGGKTNKPEHLWLLGRLMHLYTERKFTHLDSSRLNIHARLLPISDFYQSCRTGYYKAQEGNLEQIDLWTFPDSPLSSAPSSLFFPLSLDTMSRD